MRSVRSSNLTGVARSLIPWMLVLTWLPAAHAAYVPSSHRDRWGAERLVLLHRTLGAVAHPGPKQNQWAYMEVCVRKSLNNAGGMETPKAEVISMLEGCRSGSTLTEEDLLPVLAPMVEILRPDPRPATEQQLEKVRGQTVPDL